MSRQPGFFDLEERLAALSKSGDPLERLASMVDFEIFRPALKRALRRSDRSKGGRPPYDPVLMFKVLVLQAFYGLSDEQAEYQIRDRLSFMRFLGLGLGERVPDEKTIRLFREFLVRAGAIDKLFDRFEGHLEAEGYLDLVGDPLDALEGALGVGDVVEEQQEAAGELDEDERDQYEAEGVPETDGAGDPVVGELRAVQPADPGSRVQPPQQAARPTRQRSFPG